MRLKEHNCKFLIRGFMKTEENIHQVLLAAPVGFWPRGQNPRRHHRSPRVYTYKDKEYLLKKTETFL